MALSAKVDRCLCAGLIVSVGAFGGFESSAQGAEPTTAEPATTEQAHDLSKRSYTIASIEAGIVVIPNAAISNGHAGGATPLGRIGSGDATVTTGLHLMYRASPRWAIGAGALFTPFPTTDQQDDGQNHSRSYLSVGAEARYFPFTLGAFEFWLGLTGGAMIVADRYAATGGSVSPIILGDTTLNISSQGGYLGAQLGVDWVITENWVAGAGFRADRWFLPNQPVCSPLGDCATLTGILLSFNAGLTIGYRIPL